ncbi:MAG: ABC transporter permease, partial [Deltaproteobacteria bacterium]|nr:ABC transporter permease [Deltaproteobacteria bacterium]
MIGNTILLALREIRRNVLRSFLTILGIVIGVGAVITMVTIGGGATLQVQQQIASMGSNLLMLSPGKRMGPGQASGASSFKEADAQAIAAEISDIVAVAPLSTNSLKAIWGNQNWSTSVVGTDNQYLRISNRVLRTGRTFNDGELRAGAAVCIIGDTVKKKLFGAQDPMGERVRLQNFSCEVVGLLEGKGQSGMGQDQDDLVVIPIRTFQRRIAGNQDVALVQISVREGASTDKAKQDIERLMRERRHLGPSDEDNFNVMDMKDIANMLTGTTRMLTALLSAVAAVSLLVGGIGIM